MIERTRSIEQVRSQTEPWRDKIGRFTPEEWLSFDDNIALTDGENIVLLEKATDQLYTAHYFFVVKGKAAKDKAFEFLDHIFDKTPIAVLRGLTPLSNQPARWMNRQLGFQSCGPVSTPQGHTELFILHKRDYLKQRNF